MVHLCTQEINQPLMKYVKLPGANFPNEYIAPQPTKCQEIQSFSHASTFLSTYD